MASLSDTLTTVIRLVGAQQYAQQMGNMAQETAAFAQQTQSATAAAAALTLQAQAVGVQFLAWVTAGEFVLQTMRQITTTTIAGFEAFGRYNDELTRTLVIYRNMGSSISRDSLANFALQRQGQTAIPEGQTLELARRARMTGISDDLVPRYVQTLQNLELSGRMSADRAMDLLQRFSFREQFGSGGRGGGGMGGVRALANLAGGINPMILTGDPRVDQIRILNEINAKVGGMAQALQMTPEFALKVLQVDWQSLWNRLFGILEGSIAPVMLKIAGALEFFSARLTNASDNVGHMSQRDYSIFEAITRSIPIIGPLLVGSGVFGDKGVFGGLRAMGQQVPGGKAATEAEQKEQTGYLRQMAQRPGQVAFGHLSPQNQQANSFLSFAEAMSVRPS